MATWTFIVRNKKTHEIVETKSYVNPGVLFPNDETKEIGDSLSEKYPASKYEIEYESWKD